MADDLQISEDADDQEQIPPLSAEARMLEESSAALAGVVGMSPKQRYLQFDESLGKTFLHDR